MRGKRVRVALDAAAMASEDVRADLRMCLTERCMGLRATGRIRRPKVDVIEVCPHNKTGRNDRGRYVSTRPSETSMDGRNAIRNPRMGEASLH